MPILCPNKTLKYQQLLKLIFNSNCVKIALEICFLLLKILWDFKSLLIYLSGKYFQSYWKDASKIKGLTSLFVILNTYKHVMIPNFLCLPDRRYGQGLYKQVTEHKNYNESSNIYWAFTTYWVVFLASYMYYSCNLYNNSIRKGLFFEMNKSTFNNAFWDN